MKAVNKEQEKGKKFFSEKAVEIYIWLAVTAVITCWTVLMLMDGRSTKAFMGALTIVTLLVVGLWQKKAKSPFSPVFAGMTYIFIFVSVGLGTFGGAYKINHFDDFLHVTSGIWMGMALG